MNTPSRTARKFGPKLPDHPSIGTPCPACQVPFGAGDWTTLIPLGPGDDPEAREKARNGEVYIAVAVEVHWACATGIEEAEDADGPLER